MVVDREIGRLGDQELLAHVRGLVVRSNATEAELLAGITEVDERRLYLPRRTSLWDYCLYDLGFSENVASNRIAVARESRRFPQMLELLREGRIHLSGLRMLCGHLASGDGDADALLAAAAGKTKREIEELLARRCPKPAVPDQIRKLPPPRLPNEAPTAQASMEADTTEPLLAAPSIPPPITPPPPRAVIAPLSPEAYKVQFTASPALRDKIREAQDLLRHQLPAGDLAPILDRALTLLIAQVKKERFGVGRKPRSKEQKRKEQADSRHMPMAIRRAAYERDGGRCAYVDPEGRRCEARAFVELDHTEGFARTRQHDAGSTRLLCKPHNQHAADRMYGKAWMDDKRTKATRRGDPEPGP